LNLIDYHQLLDDFYHLIKDNAREMQELIDEFRERYQPKKGEAGMFYLEARMCSKTERKTCDVCPHTLTWRGYSWGKKFIKSSKRFARLPKNFWTTRSYETRLDFKRFQDRMLELNAQRKVLNEASKRIKMTMKMVLKHHGREK